MKPQGRPLPEKLYYRIGEVARLTGLKPHVLRYWEAEFGLDLSRRRAKQRLYSRRDIEVILEIKKLLYNERYSIEGARRRLKEILKGRGEEGELRKLLAEVKDELTVVMGLLEEPQGE